MDRVERQGNAVRGIAKSDPGPALADIKSEEANSDWGLGTSDWSPYFTVATARARVDLRRAAVLRWMNPFFIPVSIAL
jgi:hypothetical protein